MTEKNDNSSELRRLLARCPAGTVWRDVIDAHGNCLCRGAGYPDDGIEKILHQLDFKEKCVLDLGCNTGHNASLAMQAGAKNVIGVDENASLIECAKLLAKMNGDHSVHFMENSFNDVVRVSQFAAEKDMKIDMLLLVDFIGKNFLRKGRLYELLDTLTQYDCREMVLTVRPLYRIRKHFDMSEAEFKSLYPTPRVKGNFYHAALDIADNMGPEWQWLSPVASDQYGKGTAKVLLHFLRR